MARKVIGVYFNDETDSSLIAFASQKNFSKWVRQKILEEITHSKETYGPELIALVRQVVEAEIAAANLTRIEKEEEAVILDDSELADALNGFM